MADILWLLGRIALGALIAFVFLPYAVVAACWLKDGNRVFTDKNYWPHDPDQSP